MEGNDHTRENNTKGLRKTLRMVYTPTIEENRLKKTKNDQEKEEKYLNAAKDANEEGWRVISSSQKRRLQRKEKLQQRKGPYETFF
jgi:hypothetical protein